MKIIYLAILAMLFASSVTANSASIQLNGKVTDDDGEPIAGVVISVKGSGTTTTTNPEGEFSIQVSKLPASLVFSYVGFTPVEFFVTEKNKAKPIKIVLRKISEALSEVVVVGYSSSSSADIGSYSPVYSAKTRKGAVPGVKVQATEARHMKLQKKEDLGRSGSRLLTAGELSDFKKWKLWGDYSKSDFKTWSEHWGIWTKSRYCVQVQNQDYKAMVAEKVFLIDNDTKDTAWTAITDNTGKAELWANLNNENKASKGYTIVCQNKSINTPETFENGINRITLNKPCRVSNMVDIAFVVDATGSMGDEIKYLQEELQDVISKTTTNHKSINLRLASVFYRDNGDEYLTRYSDFQSNHDELLRFIKNQSAGGGGDTPEAVDDALTTALESLHWNTDAHAKIMFLVLDAPPHDEAKQRMNGLIRRAAEQGIRIVPVVCSGIDKSTEYLMRCVALATNGSYIFLTDDSGIGNPHIKPTTDDFKVELLNDLLQRVIGEMIYVASCDNKKPTEPVGGNAANDIKIVVYPNPTQGSIMVEAPGNVDEIYLADFTGKVLKKVEGQKTKMKFQLDLSNYPSGTYLIKYLVKDKGWGVEKVVLVH